jgi:hypothetical protein
VDQPHEAKAQAASGQAIAMLVASGLAKSDDGSSGVCEERTHLHDIEAEGIAVAGSSTTEYEGNFDSGKPVVPGLSMKQDYTVHERNGGGGKRHKGSGFETKQDAVPADLMLPLVHPARKGQLKPPFKSPAHLQLFLDSALLSALTYPPTSEAWAAFWKTAADRAKASGRVLNTSSHSPSLWPNQTLPSF